MLAAAFLTSNSVKVFVHCLWYEKVNPSSLEGLAMLSISETFSLGTFQIGVSCPAVPLKLIQAGLMKQKVEERYSHTAEGSKVDQGQKTTLQTPRPSSGASLQGTYAHTGAPGCRTMASPICPLPFHLLIEYA